MFESWLYDLSAILIWSTYWAFLCQHSYIYKVSDKDKIPTSLSCYEELKRVIFIEEITT